MNLRALILVIALLAASSSNAQPQNCSSPHFTKTTSCSFSSKVCNMANPSGFNPDPANSRYQSPTCDGTSVKNLQVLLDAYTLAPGAVKSALCQLKNVFVMTGNEAVGVWESTDRGGNVYIAIPDQLLSSASSLVQAENDILGKLLLPKSTVAYPAGRQLPAFQNPNPSRGAAVLAILAHELGHVVLSDTNADGTGGDGHRHPRPCGPPKDACFESNFLGAPTARRGWSKIDFHGQMRRWIKFGDGNSNKYQDPNLDFDNVRCDMGLTCNKRPPPAPSDANATTDIHAIYGGPFASLFAAVSPEEDFVETYKYIALAAANNQSLSLTIAFPGNGSKEVLGPVRNPSNAELNGKIGCINKLIALPY